MSYYKAEKVREAAYGKWLLVISGLAPHAEDALRKAGKHVACPIHGGKDGFRLFKDVQYTGGGVCNSCGPRSDGFELLMWLNGWDFKRCLEEVGDFLGVEKDGKPDESNHSNSKPAVNDEERKAWLQEIREKMEEQSKKDVLKEAALVERIQKLWDGSIPYGKDTYALSRYFMKRSLVMRGNSVCVADSIRYQASLGYYDEDGKEVGKFPAIICAIRDANNDIVTLHRTYLTQKGEKANVESPRKMMPIPEGRDIKGAAIRLGNPVDGVLGVAEGLETALAAYRGSQIPCWSTVNAILMESFEPPKGVHTVFIWADKDLTETGEHSANVLLERLEAMGITGYVLLPQMAIPANKKSIDWNDVFMNQGIQGFPDPRTLWGFVQKHRTMA